MARTKFFHKKVEIDGIKFDSKAEGEWYLKLKELERTGEISDLKLQPVYEIIPKLTKIIPVRLKTKTKWVTKVIERNAVYTADFEYTDNATGQRVTMEIKSKGSKLARDYPLRRKLIRRLLSEKNDLLGEEHYVFREEVVK